MCGGGASVPQDNSAQIAADQQATREANVAKGQAAINRIFGGGTAGINPATTYDPKATYYDADGNVAKPKAAAPKPAAAATSASTLAPGTPVVKGSPSYYNQPSFLSTPVADTSPGTPDISGLFTGTQSNPGQFGDSYYNDITKNYEDYYNPQLEQQYQNALKSLTLQLGQQGILDSSEGNRQIGLLNQQLQTQKETIANNGLSQAQTARQNVASERNNLLAQNQTAADPSLAAETAASGAQSVQSTPTFSPLGSVFAGLLGTGTNALSIQQGGLAGVNGGGGTFISPTSNVAGIGPGNSGQSGRNGRTVA